MLEATRKELSALLEGLSGLDDASLGTALLQQVLTERCEELLISSHEKYLSYAIAHASEQRELAQRLLITESWFERDSQQLDVFASSIPKRGEHTEGKYRVLCAPCAQGEEAFSIAARLLAAGYNADNAQVLALDYSHLALERAQSGEHPASAWRSAASPPWWLSATPAGQWRVHESVRAMVQFSRTNLVSAHDVDGGLEASQHFNAIFTRNFLIYLTADSRQIWLKRIAKLLKSEGYIFTGPSEAIHQWSPHFSLPDAKTHAYVYQLSGGPPAKINAPLVQHKLAPKLAPKTPAAKPKMNASAEAAVDHAPPTTGPALNIPTANFVRELADAGDLRGAQRALDERMKHGPNADDYVLRALLLSAEGQKQSAEEALERALYLAPRHIEALVLLSALREAAGRTSEAARLRQRLAKAQLGAPRV